MRPYCAMATETVTGIVSMTRKRPVAGVAAAFILGISLRSLLPTLDFNPLLFALCTTAAAIILTSIIIYFPGLRPVATLLVFACLGFAAAYQASPDLSLPRSLRPFMEHPDTLFLARISQPPDFYPDKTRFHLKLKRAVIGQQSYPVEGGVQLSVRAPDKTWLVGDHLLARLTLKRFHNFGTPGTFDYAWHQGIQGLYARAYLADDHLFIPYLEEAPPSVTDSALKHIDRFRQRARIWLKHQMSPTVFPLAEALFLGYRHEIGPNLRDTLSRAGVSHLLAISGLHLGLVAIISYWLMCKPIGWLFPWLLYRFSDRQFAWLIAALSALVYAVVTGLAVPTWRALLMLILWVGAIWSYRPTDGLALLSAAALMILAFSPNLLWTVSFQLSFAAFLGIVLLLPRWNRRSKRARSIKTSFKGKLLRPFVQALQVSLAVNVMVLPLVAYYFHGISLAGLFANTLLVPLVGFLILPLGLLCLMLFAVSPWLAKPLPVVLAALLEPLTECISWLAHQSWAYHWVGLISTAMVILFYIGLWILLCSDSRTKKLIRLGTLAAVAGLYLLLQPLAPGGRMPERLYADILDVGQGSSTLVVFPHGRTMLVDGGGFFDHSFDIGRHVVAPYLWQRGITHLDYVVLSHDHPDHANGLRFILAHFDVGEFWESGLTEDPTHRTLLSRIAARKGIPTVHVNSSTEVAEIDGCRVVIRNPGPGVTGSSNTSPDLNCHSLVITIQFGSTTLVLPGDIDRATEEAVFSAPNQSGNVLLVAPHHGSEKSCGSKLLDRLKPANVIISCGYQNWFGFPSPVVLHRLHERSITVYRTDLNGTVFAMSDGMNWKIHCHSETARRPRGSCSAMRPVTSSGNP